MYMYITMTIQLTSPQNQSRHTKINHDDDPAEDDDPAPTFGFVDSESRTHTYT
eukprot:m.20844 g.20844  ORF g.20844 m.20844 type:complete len:53 (-) comp13134_c0_seq1:17-175(-)